MDSLVARPLLRCFVTVAVILASSSLALASLGNDVVFPPQIPPPRNPGDVVGFVLQNPLATAAAAQPLSFGQVFIPGRLPAGRGLVAVIHGRDVPVQLDIKTAYPDGSVRMGIISFAAPPVGAHRSVPAILRLGDKAAAKPPIDLAVLGTGKYGLEVALRMRDASGKPVALDISPAPLLAAALQTGKTSYWLRGDQATEARLDVPVRGSFHVTFDIRLYSDGTTRTDVQFNNDLAMQPSGGTVEYEVTLRQHGAPVWRQAGIRHFQYQTWHREIWSRGAPTIVLQQDTAALEHSGAIPAYDLTGGVSTSLLAAETEAMSRPGWGAPLAANGVAQDMTAPGGRPDVGPTTQANAVWLLTQTAAAGQYALGQADAAGSVPWHFYDPTEGTYVTVTKYPNIWTDKRGGSDAETIGLTQQVSDATGWTPDTAHQPDLSFVPYLLTGDRYRLDQLNAQASWSETDMWPSSQARNGASGLIANAANQVRGEAWSLREIDEAAYANPDGSAEKAYFTQMAANNWAHLVEQLPGWTAEQGATHGYIPGAYGDNNGLMAPWQQDYFATTAAQAAMMGFQQAQTVLRWETNFIAGRFLNAANGFDPHDGIAYNLAITSTEGTVHRDWAAVAHATRAAGLSNDGGWAQSQGNYAQLALAALAGIITATDSPRAATAYRWLLTSGAPFTRRSDYESDPSMRIVPLIRPR